MFSTKRSAILAGLGGLLAMGLAAPNAEAGHYTSGYSIGPVHTPTYVSSPYACSPSVVVQPAPMVYAPPVIVDHTPVYRDYPVYTRPHPVRPRYIGHHGNRRYQRHHGYRSHNRHHRRGFSFSFGFGSSH